MAVQTDTGQLKKMGIFLIGLGLLMALVGYFMTAQMWQVYVGIAAALLGGGLTAYAMKKG